MLPRRLLLTTTFIYTYLILVYTLALEGSHGLWAAAGDVVYGAAAATVLVSCAGAAGMACFALGFRPLPEGWRQRAHFYAVGLCFAGQLCLEMFAPVPALFSLGIALAAGGWGFLTAYTLCRIATEVSSAYFGRFVGFACGLSALLQFIIGMADGYFPAMLLTRGLAPACLAAFVWSMGGQGLSLGKSLPQRAVPGGWQEVFRQSRGCLWGGAVLLSLLTGLSDSVTIMHFADYAPSFPGSRLFYGAGLVFFGWLADRRMALLPGIVLLTNAYYLWYRTLAADAAVFVWLAQIVEAVYSAPAVILLTAGFLHIAANSDAPERWAALGRIIGLSLTSLGLVLGLSLWPVTSTTMMLVIYTTMLLAAVALFYRWMLAYLETLREAVAAQVTASPDEKSAETGQQDISAAAMAAYCRHYHITAREAAVLAAIVKGQSAEEIAESHFVTKRTVRFHISNLLHKTGNKNQLALVADFHQQADTLLAEEQAPPKGELGQAE